MSRFRHDSLEPADVSRPEQLRARLKDMGLNGFLVPVVDAHRSEFPAAADARAPWLTGFTGSAGMAALLLDRGAIFVDGRYELQAAQQVDGDVFSVAPTKNEPDAPAKWLRAAADEWAETAGDAAALVIGYDPWLHTAHEMARLRETLADAPIRFEAVDANPIDALWTDRPARPDAPAYAHPLAYAGESAAEKRARIAETLKKDALDAVVLSLPDEIAWLLNIRAADVPHTPVLLAFAVLTDDARVHLFTDADKVPDDVRTDWGGAVQVSDWSAFDETLATFSNQRVAMAKGAIPSAIADRLRAAGAEPVWRAGLVADPKAQKNAAEIDGARATHLIDGAAMASFLAWLDAAAPSGELTEMAVAHAVTQRRREAGERHGAPLRDESFSPIVGYGPNGAVVHYRVTPETNRKITPGGVLLVDSGGQFDRGTTDVTRTIAVGAPPRAAVLAATRVLQGMIAVSRLRFPEKTAGRDIDAFARRALWAAGLDYDHGTGHGVGSFLGVHEGPASISKRGGAAMTAGMILSNEPGCYVAGDFGIRIENLVLVRAPETPEGGDRPMLAFETLTFVPIDRRLIEPSLLDEAERDWLDDYHAEVFAKIAPLLASDSERAWLQTACAPLEDRAL